MLTLDQVKLLENKVESLIEMVKSLYGERDALRDALQKKDKEIEELSSKVASYETEQEKIEERVVNALNQLDIFQNSVASAKAILSQSNGAESETNYDSSDVQHQEKSEASDTSSHSNEGGMQTADSSTTTQSSESTYTVKAGDGLWRIAKNHGLTLDELKAMNQLTSNIIQPGQVLIVSK